MKTIIVAENICEHDHKNDCARDGIWETAKEEVIVHATRASFFRSVS